ncbi:MAG: amidohydrolase [Candidatus Symbiothrix sp.]|jgi:aminobenzoyl-glutamate utilization protein B|nr:amidohydrolase [Candidatus Symbiothrix sp.]
MKKTVILVLSVLLTISAFAQKSKKNNPLNNVAIKYLNNNFSTYDALQKEIWNNAELGFIETQSSNALQQHLKDNGFSVEAGVAGMPTAFVATYGSGSPVIAILAEFDALPGLSQDTVPYRKVLIEGGSGHGCGHNTFGVGSSAGAVAIKQWLQSTGNKGTIKVYGTPAEEGGGGKVYLVRDGFFKGVDIVLDWHPASGNAVSVGTGTAIQMVDYKFYGIPAHSAGSPDKGRSALDGVESLNYMVNMLREHVPTSSRIHYVIPDGGDAPNVVPHYARVSYYIRSPKREILKDLTEWIGSAAEGAAKGTQTRVEIEIVAGFYELLSNRKLSEIVQKNLETVGGVHYDARELAFAKEIVKGLNLNDTILKSAASVQPLRIETPSTGGGSTDVGDVSWNVPTVSFGTATFVPGSPGHSWQNVASDGTTIGTKGLINAAKTFSLTAIELFANPKLVAEAKAEFESKRGADFKYESLIGDRKPALDYRVKK